MALQESEFDIPAGAQDNRSAHTVVPNVCLRNNAARAGEHFFIKYNKHGNKTASILEAGFSAIASSCILPGLTPPMTLLCDANQEITGVVSRNVREIVSAGIEDAPTLHFLSELPKGHLGALLQNHTEHPDKEIDWDALASVLCASYFLEEDDLHRSNIGYFVKQHHEKMRLGFFKIDHDLCFSDSIMSRHAVRFWNLRHNSHSFDITRTDLEHFPDVRNYGTHYWPTRYSLLAKPCDPKIYDNFSDIAAFAGLARNPEFIKAKWRQFYRLILIPEAVFAASLARTLNTTDPEQKAYFDQILSATLAKQQALAACLFSIESFRDWLQEGVFEDDFFATTLGGMPSDPQDDAALQAQNVCTMRQQIFLHRQLLPEFSPKDTPFHAAIRLELYRFDQTWHDYGQYCHVKNADGNTPSALLLKKCLQDSPRVSEKAKQALADMNARGCYQNVSKNIAAEIARLRPRSYFAADSIKDEQVLYEQIQRISADTTLTLKMKKHQAIGVFTAFIVNYKQHNPRREVLLKLKENLQTDMRFAFIRLLQSRFWIFRYFRTLLLRGTTTFRQINGLLDDAIQNFPANQPRP